MSRGRRTVGNPILMVVLIVLTIVAIAIPFVLVGGYFYYRHKLNDIRQYLVNSISDFWLDDDDKKLFKASMKKLAQANKNIEKAVDHGTKSGLSLNKDGSFSARSNIGKEVRATIDQNQPVAEEMAGIVDDLTNTPVERWIEFDMYAKRVHAFLKAQYAWGAGFAVTLVVCLIKGMGIQDSAVAGVYGAAVLSIITLAFLWFFSKEEAHSYTPKPPLVTLENLDAW